MKNRKKIAFVIYGLGSGGAERVIVELANNLVESYEVFLITLVKTEPFYKPDQSIKLLHCSENTKTSTNPIMSTANGLYRIEKLRRILKNYKVELAIGFMTSSNIYAICASKLRGIPCIISERSNHNIKKLSKSLELVRNLSYKFCNYLIVQTNGNKNYYEKFLENSKIIVIANPISKDFENTRKTNIDVKKDKIILNVGSFKEGKAQYLLIKAFCNINDKDHRIVFVGDGPTKNDHIKLVKKLKLENRIVFAGKQKQISQYYNQAMIFVFTSEHEGFPNALLEALFFGIPTISTNCEHGPNDLITDGVNGFLIPVGDQQELEKKLTKLLQDKILQQNFSENAMKSTSKYNIADISASWRKYIETLI